MKELFLVALVTLAAFTAGWWIASDGLKLAACTECANSVEAVFSPGAESRLAGLLQSANKSIDVELYQFSNTALQGELADAQARGIVVRVILEPRLNGDDNVDSARFLCARGVDVRWARLAFALTHSKFAIIDEAEMLIGSPNWSYSAMQRNREAAVLIKGGKAVQDTANIFEEDWDAGSPACS